MTSGDPENLKSDERKTSNLSTTDKPFIGIRWILVFMLFLTSFNLFFLRNSIGVIVVAMVNTTHEEDTDYSADACPEAINQTEPTNAEVKGPQYYWEPNEQGLIIALYFWGYFISRLFLSRLSEKFGQRETLCLVMLSAGIITLASPWAASVSGYFFAATRFLTGISFGPAGAAFYGLLSAWAPKSEMSTMSSLGFSGGTIGMTLGVFCSGWLSEALGWPSVFYLSGAMQVIVAPFWILLITNHPFDHKWLSNYERELLKDKKDIRTKKNVPYFKILTSPYVLILVYCGFARSWLDQAVNNEGPSFFGYKIGLDLDIASYVTGASSLSSVVFLLVYGKSTDTIVNKKYLSKRNTRRLFHIIGVGMPTIILLGITWTGCNSTAAIIWWILLGATSVATVSSAGVSVLDIAPNHTATVNALLGVGSLGAAIAPSAIAALVGTFKRCFSFNAVLSCHDNNNNKQQ
ncbi:Sialin [Armadillidium nasatum]|uniref:Sialin n=1 Tax=Armadillidium nasatum TaxID=96803 RepID=A0A5N5SMI5_9CRUS|nr:Sialin [Armadillidium nasatum]